LQEYIYRVVRCVCIASQGKARKGRGASAKGDQIQRRNGNGAVERGRLCDGETPNSVGLNQTPHAAKGGSKKEEKAIPCVVPNQGGRTPNKVFEGTSASSGRRLSLPVLNLRKKNGVSLLARKLRLKRRKGKKVKSGKPKKGGKRRGGGVGNGGLSKLKRKIISVKGGHASNTFNRK